MIRVYLWRQVPYFWQNLGTQDCQTMECKGNKWSFRNGILRKGGFSNSHLRKPTNLLNVCLRMWILLSKVLKFCCQVYFIFTHIAKLKIKTKLLGSMRFFLRYGAFNMTSLHFKCVLHINYFCNFLLNYECLEWTIKENYKKIKSRDNEKKVVITR